MIRFVFAFALFLFVGCGCGSEPPPDITPDVCWPPSSADRAIDTADACLALDNAWMTHASSCGPLVCPYPPAPVVDIDANSACIVALLERVDAGAGCGELAAVVEACGACL